MRSRYIIAVLLVILSVLVFFVLPVYPYSASVDTLYTGGTVTAQTSFSYVMLGCGVVHNPVFYPPLGTEAPLRFGYQPWYAARWVCGSIPVTPIQGYGRSVEGG